MSLFTRRRSGGPHDLEMSMAGVKPGSRVLQLGGPDTELIASLAAVAGLQGKACAITETQESADACSRAAAARGVLVDVSVAALDTVAPDDAASFDLVVLKDVLARLTAYQRVRVLRHAYAALRPGGRCLVIERAMRGGLGAVISRAGLNRHYLEGGGAVTALDAEGFVGVRLLAERDARRFIEGTRPAGTTGDAS